MRSALTMLGIIIGVGAVIAMIAIGTGASRRIAEQISSMGSNLLMILPGATTSGGVRMGAGTQPTLTMADAEAILKECPAVSDIAPILSGVAQIVYGHQNWSTGVVGTTPGMLNVRDWPLAVRQAFYAAGRQERDKSMSIGTDSCRKPVWRYGPRRPDNQNQEDTFHSCRRALLKRTVSSGAGPGRYHLCACYNGPEKAFRHNFPGNGEDNHGERKEC